MPFTTHTDDQEKELFRLNRLYWKEAQKCEHANAYLVGRDAWRFGDIADSHD
jgi:hypothetical protein